MLVGMWALRNLPDGAVHVFSSCLVCFEELTFLLMFFPKWLRVSSPLCNKKRHLFVLFQFTATSDLCWLLHKYIYIYIYIIHCAFLNQYLPVYIEFACFPSCLCYNRFCTYFRCDDATYPGSHSGTATAGCNQVLSAYGGHRTS